MRKIKSLAAGVAALCLLAAATARAQDCQTTHAGLSAFAGSGYSGYSDCVAASHSVVTTVLPVQVVSPQVITAAPQGVVTQNAYTQQVLGAALQVAPGVAQAAVTYQPAAVAAVPVGAAVPAAVALYNQGVVGFSGTQNFVRTQAAPVASYAWHRQSSASGFSHQRGAANAGLGHRNGLSNGFGQGFNQGFRQGLSQGAAHAGAANNGGGRHRSKTVTKSRTVTKTR